MELVIIFSRGTLYRIEMLSLLTECNDLSFPHFDCSACSNCPLLLLTQMATLCLHYPPPNSHFGTTHTVCMAHTNVLSCECLALRLSLLQWLIRKRARKVSVALNIDANQLCLKRKKLMQGIFPPQSVCFPQCIFPFSNCWCKVNLHGNIGNTTKVVLQFSRSTRGIPLACLSQL